MKVLLRMFKTELSISNNLVDGSGIQTGCMRTYTRNTVFCWNITMRICDMGWLKSSFMKKLNVIKKNPGLCNAYGRTWKFCRGRFEWQTYFCRWLCKLLTLSIFLICYNIMDSIIEIKQSLLNINYLKTNLYSPSVLAFNRVVNTFI